MDGLLEVRGGRDKGALLALGNISVAGMGKAGVASVHQLQFRNKWI